MPDIDLKFEGAVEIDEHSPMWKRLVAVLAATVALLGALGAFLHERAEKAEELAAVQAQAAASKGLSLSVSRTTEWKANLQIVTEYNLLHVRAFGARASGNDELETSLMQIADDVYSRTPLLSNDTYRLDPNPSNRYLADRWYDVNRAIDEQRAKSETAEAWHASAEQYAAVLAVFAAALFLFGLAQIARLGRFVFVGFGVVAMVAAVVLMVRAATQNVPTTSARALDALATAQTLQLAGDYEGAITSFTAAIDARADYADAYQQRALARWQEAGDANPVEPYIEYITGPPLQLALDDTISAIRYGATDKTALNQFAALLIHAERYKDAERQLRRVLTADEELAVAWTNLGATRAALGDASGARAAYSRAIELSRSEPSPYQRKSLFAAARAVLDEVGTQQSTQFPLTSRLSAELTEAQRDIEVGPSGSPSASSSADEVGLTDVGSIGSNVTATVTTTASHDVPFAIVGYFRTKSSRPWHQPTTMVQFGTLAPASPGAVVKMPMGTCPVAGDYRLDLIVDGRVAKSQEVTVEEPASGHMAAEQDLIAEAFLCRPQHWTRATDDTTLSISDESGTTIEIGAVPVGPIPADGSDPLDAVIRSISDPAFVPDPSTVQLLGGRTGRWVRLVATDGRYQFVFASEDGLIVRYLVATATEAHFAQITEVLGTVLFLPPAA
jgi:tetratricopeptide (TPR) repeat protein